jgi:hypothetical protein
MVLDTKRSRFWRFGFLASPRSGCAGAVRLGLDPMRIELSIIF